MAFTFEPTLTRYWIEIRNPDDFRALMAASGSLPTLSEKLDPLPGVCGVVPSRDGSAVYLSIDADVDGPDLKQQISDIIEAHIALCRAGG